ncbi:Nudix hydrolase 3, variant 3 [Salvia divinorum]|uniref:Nudix hydrolase 3, variant 3 n=1 Tax=Salvia divinorum TaxID=28513 RepID=A0ABD1HKD5_SALDI
MAAQSRDQVVQVEYLDVLTRTGEKTGVSKPRGDVHRDGDYHRAVHVWIFAESTQELLLQLRAECKDSWPGHWDISSAGHISAGDSSLVTARRELQEELGITLPKDAFEQLYIFLEEWVTNEGKFINNEYCDVYLVTTIDPIPLEAFTLQESEVSAVKYVHFKEYRSLLAKKDPQYVPYDVNGQYCQLFEILSKRYKQNAETRATILQKQLNRYAPISLGAEYSGLSSEDKEVLALVVKAARIMDDIFFIQVWYSNPSLRDWLQLHAKESRLNNLKQMYFAVNKSPWSSLDENEAFLTTADSAVKLLPEATKPVIGWKGIEYRTAFPIVKPPGASFYPPDMDKMEFELWKKSLPEDKQKEAIGFFNVIKRQSERIFDESLSVTTHDTHDLYIVPYSQEYSALLTKASDLLHKAGDLTSCSSLKKLLHSKADAFLSNEYYDSDIAWMELDSKLDITIGPYETYEDALFGCKATFEAFVGVRDDEATGQLKLFGDHLQVLERNLPMDDIYKSEDVTAAPIRVVQLIYNAGDVKGPQTIAFNLPNDERIVNERGTSMVMLKNVSEAKFKLILLPISHELQDVHSAMEEAKADIVGLWALRFLVNKNLLPKTLLKSMYVSFLAGCFRSIRFGLEEAHGKGQALQFNYLFEKGAFLLQPDGSFSVEFNKVEDAVESLSREILTIQGRGDKCAAEALLSKYCVLTQPLKSVLEKLSLIEVPVDILPHFPVADEVFGKEL